jgi:hypothetical protein
MDGGVDFFFARAREKNACLNREGHVTKKKYGSPVFKESGVHLDFAYSFFSSSFLFGKTRGCELRLGVLVGSFHLGEPHQTKRETVDGHRHVVSLSLLGPLSTITPETSPLFTSSSRMIEKPGG